MVAVIDPASYTVQFQNKTGLQKLGDLSGRKCYETIAGCPTPCAFCKMPEAMSTGQVTINEVLLPNNQYLLVQWSKAMMQDGRTHIIETITDVTEHKRMEDAASKAEKMEALSRLAGGMAHDINNLLTVIMGASEQISSKMDNDATVMIPIQQMRNAADRAAEITRRLVAFSHHQLIEPSIIDLNLVMRELESRIRVSAGEGVSLELSLHDDPAALVADRQQIDQIVSVLVSNAREAMRAGGCLTIATSIAVIGVEAAKKQDVKPGTYVRLVVRDTGCGIPPEMQAHLFEPFYLRTGEVTGRGLGLASVYGMVRQMGGFIEVTSERGIGTTFSINLPRSEQAGSVGAHPPMIPVSVSRPTILLVEDDEDVRMAVGDMLKLAGYRVQEACDGVDALQQLQDMASPPHLVLTDVMMPRMTGPQLATQIQAMMPGIRLLYMSGYSDHILEPFEGRRLAFIAKPFTGHDLIRRVCETLAL
jgi:signal transduction histidine kinase